MKDLKIFTDNIDYTAISQINNLVEQVAFDGCKIRIMPDVHAGAGCVIGFTGNLGDKVIPNIVGVDIGCGMKVLELDNKTIDYAVLNEIIRKYIPYGQEVHKTIGVRFPEMETMVCYKELRNFPRFSLGIGSLGSGNHFIEVDKDEDGKLYLVIHSGSRNLGKQVADIYQDKANQICNFRHNELDAAKTKLISDYKAAGNTIQIRAGLKKLDKDFAQSQHTIPKEFSYLTGKDREDYLYDMNICQKYAVLNRQTMADIIIKRYNDVVSDDAKLKVLSSYETIHNYISFEDNIIRKGAISAKLGEKVIIPMNMRDGSLICIGKGNDEWNQSAPHGAGRVMSRNQAKESLDMDTYRNDMKDIWTSSVNENTIDEAPEVYKPMEEIIKNIEPTATVINIIKPVFNFKAD